MKRFVVVVDVQGDFMWADGALPVPGAAELIAPMNAWLAGLSPADTTGVLFTFDTHVPDIYAGSPEAEQFPPHCERGTPGWDLVLDMDRVQPGIPLYRLEKGVFNMWEEEGLAVQPVRPGGASMPREVFFARLQAEGIQDVTVIGVAADFCVRWAVEGLLARGFRVTVPAGLTRGIVREIDAVAADFRMEPLELV